MFLTVPYVLQVFQWTKFFLSVLYFYKNILNAPLNV